MGDTGTEWPRSRRTPPQDPGLAAAAAANPGGSVAEIDRELVDDPNGYVPAEAIHGCWIVGPDGELTGEYAENPGHGVPVDDFSELAELDHFWGWLPADPVTAVRGSVADLLAGQVPGAVLEWMKVIGRPEVLTGARPVENEERLVLVRSGVAVPFALSVGSPQGGREILWGVFTWAASGLDDPAAKRRDRVWFDLEVSADWGKARLAERIYEVELS